MSHLTITTILGGNHVPCLRHYSNSKDSNSICLGLEPSLSHTLPYLEIDTIFGTIYLCDLFLKSITSNKKAVLLSREVFFDTPPQSGWGCPATMPFFKAFIVV